MKRKTVTRKIKKLGNGAMIALHKADLDDLGARVGAEVSVTIATHDDSYVLTRASALKVRQRYAQTLEILGE